MLSINEVRDQAKDLGREVWVRNWGTQNQRQERIRSWQTVASIYHTGVSAKANIGTISFTRANYSYFDTSLDSDMDEKNILGTKKMNSCLAGYNFERLCAKAWHTAINQTRRAQSGLARFDALSRKYRQHCNYSCKVLFAELYMPFSNQSKKTECVSISVSLVWQLGTVSELQHREDGLSNHDFAAFRFIFRSIRAVQILRALRKSDNDLWAW